MELTCLNCTGTFTVEDEAVSAGGLLRCPVCGREQPLVRHEAGNEPPFTAVSNDTPLPGGAQRPAEVGSAFRRPMQAFKGRPPASPSVTPAPGVRTGAVRAPSDEVLRPAAQSAAPSQATPRPPGAAPRPSSSQTTPPPVPPRTTSKDAVPGGPPADGSAVLSPGDRLKVPEAPAAPSGPWLAKSPSGLVLEFPSSNLLVNWSAIVDNPAPYQVSRGGDDWTSLEEFLREVKQGTRATAAFRRSAELGAKATRGNSEFRLPADANRGGPSPVDVPGKTSGRTGDSRGVSSTAQFQFKLAEPEEPKTNKWLVAALVFVASIAVGGGAAYAVLTLL